MKRLARLCVPFAVIMKSMRGIRRSNTVRSVAVAVALVLATIPTFANPGSLHRVIVAPFSDESHSGFLNLDEGVASLLSLELDSAGFDVVDWDEVEATLQNLGLAPDPTGNLIAAGRTLGAGFVIEGTIRSINIKEASLYIGFLRLSGGAADVELAADVYSTETGTLAGSYAATGYREGGPGFAVELGSLFVAAEELAVCTGGLRARRDGYSLGQPVLLSYRNASAPAGWYSVEVFTSGGRFLRWLGWKYMETGACVQWTWDQTDSLGTPVSPGIYSARISDGDVVLEYTNFQVRPDMQDTAEFQQITVGETDFDQTLVGSALHCALVELASRMAPNVIALSAETETEDVLALSAAEPQAGSQAEEITGSSQSATTVGQIAAVLPDGRLAITLGVTSGISVGETLVVLSADSAGSESVVKGQIILTDVRETVSYALPVDAVDVEVGDVVRVP